MAALTQTTIVGRPFSATRDAARIQPCQVPVFTPVRCTRGFSTQAHRFGLIHSSSSNPLRRHQLEGLQQCRSSAAAAVSIQPSQLEQRDSWEVLQALQRCRNAFVCLAACTIWGFLSSGTSSSLPFASLAFAAAETSTTGVQTAVKSAWTGLAAGVLHTLCGPDHLAALTPLTIGRNRVAASALGALWGFGHSTGQLILGLVMVLLKDRFHDFLPALERWSGLVVAATLIAIGVMGIYESYFEKEEEHSGHVEEEQQAMKLALAGAGPTGGVGAIRTSVKASFATYATGIIYGLQPDALFVVVPALALPTKAAAIAYCTMFVIGTVLAMGGYTLLIGTTSAALTKERPWLQAHLSTIASAIAIVVGILVGLSGLGFEVPFLG